MSLVATRERRANAGSRMRDLIEQEMELEEMFQEVEDDEDFMDAKEEEDVVDSDFDQSSSGPDENEDIAEKQILLEEKQEKKKLKKSKLPPAGPSLRLRKKEASKSVVTSKEQPSRSNQSESTSNAPDKKKKPIAQAPLLHGIRSSSRTHTVQSKQMLAEKLKEYEKKRAAHPKREKVIAQPKTQEELLAQAKETEAKNLASLRAFELKEAEKKMTAKQYKKNVITGPFIREISFVDYSDKREVKRLKLITEVPKKGKGKGVSKEVQQEKDVLDSTCELGDVTEGKAEDKKVESNEDKNEDMVEEKSEDMVEDKNEETVEGKKEDKREARNLLVFSQFPKTEEVKLFQEWRKKPQRAKKVICPFTGLIAKYKDPKTGIPYANMEAYSKIQNLVQHKYLWSDSYSAYIYNTDQKPAKGVPPGFQRYVNE
ncbi:7833_t:CDS:2 [Acaulospora morrowiae]|uniref:7833_t:CDS:1 n=1 Tax=Acaulospora morrowiae TaxID=94023 RepID=A0A9N9AUR8_9GLOM|nr:7833_t:CDS:2 [Acaulospora morrowiae]